MSPIRISRSLQAQIDRAIASMPGGGNQATSGQYNSAVVTNEHWAIFDTNRWDGTIHVGTGTTGVTTNSLKRRVGYLNAAASSDAALVFGKSAITNVFAAALSKVTDIHSMLIMEFEARVTGLANIDNTKDLWGLACNGAAPGPLSGHDCVGFCLQAGALNTVTDSSITGLQTFTIVDTTKIPGWVALTTNARYRIVLTATKVYFFVNGYLVAAHTTDLTTLDHMVESFYHASKGASGASSLELGVIQTRWA